MPVGYILDFAGATSDQYDQVVERMELGGRVAPGAIFHVAGPGPNGGWRVVDVWESDDVFNDFAQEKIIPFTSELGMGEPAIQRFDVNEITDSGRPRSDIALFQVVKIPDM